MGIMRTKSVEQSIRDTEEPEFQLRKALGPLDLTLFGIGVIIGTGLFVLTGEAAALYSGPAVALSYVVGGIVCALAALCYAEFASTVPVSGSAYTFSYAALGEFVAWLIGWDLILEFTIGAAVVSKGWSGYLVSVLELVGIELPPGLYAATAGFSHDFVALIVVALVTTILVIGIKLSSQFNQVITTIKILVTLFVIGFGIFFIKASNLTPFIPPPKQPPAAAEATLQSFVLPSLLGIDTIYGVTGIFTAAALVFIVFTGLVPYGTLATAAPAATALQVTPFPAAQLIVSLAILIGLTVVVMILILGQSRVAFAMSRDNLLPLWFSRVHTRFRTPHRITIITGVVAGLLAFWLPLTALAELVNIGTLAAFILVSIGIIVLRRSRPDLPRAFKVPGYPVVPILSALACFLLMGFLTAGTWVRFFVWMAIGIVFYFAYSRSHSRLANEDSSAGTNQEA
jgi:APA family basic amino acid/polyamine antiporter